MHLGITYHAILSYDHPSGNNANGMVAKNNSGVRWLTYQINYSL